ncbi:MAG: hypothetical protein CMB24_04910 [Euryarchaeota archaeon]|jgi:hypothetical protein|nr:hypothetical protein [Euryarchaeota archaeon]|tara:strand:+ start:2339 stop:2929 length:591 start_codon:yes stop_codon:yes gene_type:complete
MKRVIALAILLSLIGNSQALPEGIGDRADDGCLCHGGSDDSTTVSVDGLPEVYNSSMEYNLTLTIESPVELNEVQGGFRILISQGELIGEGWQIIDEGYTHTTEINDRRQWDAVWVAPEADDELATFVIHGNAVNGNGAVSDDEWNSITIAIPGPNYTGEVVTPELSTREISDIQITVGIIGIIALFALAFYAIKD